MRLEEQVVTLELGERLKRLGVRQESLFYWTTQDGREWVITPKENTAIDIRDGKEYGWPVVSAFTVAELGRLLPQRLPWESKNIFLRVYLESYPLTSRKGWLVNYVARRDGITYSPYAEEAVTEADARAKMLVYVIENKLITLPTDPAKGAAAA